MRSSMLVEAEESCDVHSLLRSLVVKETAFWQASAPDRRLARDRFRELNETQKDAFILTITDGFVAVASKPSALFTVDDPPNPQIGLYAAYIQRVVRRFCPHLTTEIFIDVFDARGQDDSVPVLVFQKRCRSNSGAEG